MTTRSNIDLQALTVAISKGVLEGNAPLLSAMITAAGQRHDLRDMIQANVDKVWSIDGELKLVKGVMVSLTGQGDGSSGLVPRMETDVKRLGDDVSTLRGDMRSLKDDVETMVLDLKAIRVAQGQSKSFMDGWKGVAIALGICGTCVSIVAALAAACLWLYTHGGAH